MKPKKWRFLNLAKNDIRAFHSLHSAVFHEDILYVMSYLTAEAYKKNNNNKNHEKPNNLLLLLLPARQ